MGREAADVLVVCFVCMHMNKLGAIVELGAIIDAISNLNGEELERLREAVEHRRERLVQSAASGSSSTAPTPKPKRKAGAVLVFPLPGGGQATHPLRWQER